MADEDQYTLGKKATEQIAQTVREVSRRMMNETQTRARWHFHGGGSGRAGGFITFQPFDVVPGIGSICDAVVATVLTSECGSSIQPGDIVNVWDRTRSWFAMPESLLFASSGSAHYMKVSAQERYALPEDPGPCRWEVVSMNCIEDETVVY